MDAGDDGLEGDTPGGVGLRVEEDLRMQHIVGPRAGQVGPGQFVEIPLVEEHARALVIDIEEILETVEIIGRAQALDRVVGQGDTVARRQGEHHFGLERAFDMDMQLGLGQSIDEACCRVHGAALSSQTDRLW